MGLKMALKWVYAGFRWLLNGFRGAYCCCKSFVCRRKMGSLIQFIFPAKKRAGLSAGRAIRREMGASVIIDSIMTERRWGADVKLLIPFDKILVTPNLVL